MKAYFWDGEKQKGEYVAIKLGRKRINFAIDYSEAGELITADGYTLLTADDETFLVAED